jgi:D-alanine-D-alanine ligase
VRVGLLFDGLSALGKSPEVVLLEAIEAVEKALQHYAGEVVRVPVTGDGRWIERVRKGKFDLVFNLCEGIDGYPQYEPMVISVLELLGIPFTGNSSWTTGITLRKHILNSLLEHRGLPVPAWSVARRGEDIVPVGFPAICKPAAEDASVGIEQRSVVRSSRALHARVAEMLEQWDEILIQRFVDGREINVGILGDEVLPIAEIDFADMPEGMWRIVTYRAKWDIGSDEDLGAKPRCPANLPKHSAKAISQIARRAWTAVKGEGYGRVDMRIDRDGRPWILEVNANPDISPDAGLARMAQAAGRDYNALVKRVCDLAVTTKSCDSADAWAKTLRLSGLA